MLSIQESEHFNNVGRFGGVLAIFLSLLSFTLPSLKSHDIGPGVGSIDE